MQEITNNEPSKFLRGGVRFSELEGLSLEERKKYLSSTQNVLPLIKENPSRCIELMIESESFESLNRVEIGELFFDFLTLKQFESLVNIPSFLEFINNTHIYLRRKFIDLFSLSLNNISGKIIFELLHNEFFEDHLPDHVLGNALLKLNKTNPELANQTILELNLNYKNDDLYPFIYSILITNSNPQTMKHCLYCLDFFIFCLQNGHIPAILLKYQIEDVITTLLLEDSIIEELEGLDEAVDRIFNMLPFFQNDENIVDILLLDIIDHQSSEFSFVARQLTDQEQIKRLIKVVFEYEDFLHSSLMCQIKDKNWIFDILNSIDFRDTEFDAIELNNILNDLGNCDHELIQLLREHYVELDDEELSVMLNHFQNQNLILELLEDDRFRKNLLNTLKVCEREELSPYSSNIVELLLSDLRIIGSLSTDEISYYFIECSDEFLSKILDNPGLRLNSEIVEIYLRRENDTLTKKILEKICNRTTELSCSQNDIDFILTELYQNKELEPYFSYYNVLMLGTDHFRNFLIDSYNDDQLSFLFKNMESVVSPFGSEQLNHLLQKARDESFIQSFLKSEILLGRIRSSIILEKIQGISIPDNYNDNLEQVLNLLMKIDYKLYNNDQRQEYIYDNISLFRFILAFTDEEKIQKYLKRYIQERSLENKDLFSQWNLENENQIEYTKMDLESNYAFLKIDPSYGIESFFKIYIHYAVVLKDYIGRKNTNILLERYISEYSHLLEKEELYQILNQVNNIRLICLAMGKDFDTFYPLLVEKSSTSPIDYSDIEHFSIEQQMKLLSNPLFFQKIFNVTLPDSFTDEYVEKLIKLFYPSNEIRIDKLRKHIEMACQKNWYDERFGNNPKLYRQVPSIICNALDKYEGNRILDMELYLETVVSELIENIEKVFKNYKPGYYNGFLKLCEKYYNTESLEEKRVLKKELDHYNAIYISQAEKQFLDQRVNRKINRLKSQFKVREEVVLKKYISKYRREWNLRRQILKRVQPIIERYSGILNSDFEKLEKDIIELFWENRDDDFIIDGYFNIEKPNNIIGYNKRKLERRIINNYLPFFQDQNLEDKNEIIRYLKGDKLKLSLDNNLIPKVEELKKLVEEIEGNIALEEEKLFLEAEYDRINIPSKEEVKKYQGKINQYNHLKREVNQLFTDYIKERYDDLPDYEKKFQLQVIGDSLEFTDENYYFDGDVSLDIRLIKEILMQCDFSELLTNEESYQNVYSLFHEQNFIPNFLLLEQQFVSNISVFQIITLINHYATLNSLYEKEYHIKLKNLDYEKYKNLFSYIDILTSMDRDTLDLLGEDVAKKVYYSTRYTGGTTGDERIKVACELIAKSYLRNERTIPEVSGITEDGIIYEMYDYRDPSQLISGIDTDACFKVGGNANDLLAYCILNKNGFILKFSDTNHNFIGRVSGFRSGNIIYLNELRSIYDEAFNNPKTSEENSEKLRDALEKWAHEMISKLDGNDSIDAILITESYNCSHTDWADVTDNVDEDDIVVTDYEDWDQFLKNEDIVTYDLQEEYKNFYTDAYDYNLLLVYGDYNFEHKKYDVNANYLTSRKEPQVILDFDNPETINQIKKYQIIKSNLDQDIEIDSINYDNMKVGIIGDDWYVLIDQNDEVEACIINDSKQVLNEIQNYIYPYIKDFKEFIMKEYQKKLY